MAHPAQNGLITDLITATVCVRSDGDAWILCCGKQFKYAKYYAEHLKNIHGVFQPPQDPASTFQKNTNNFSNGSCHSVAHEDANFYTNNPNNISNGSYWSAAHGDNNFHTNNPNSMGYSSSVPDLNHINNTENRTNTNVMGGHLFQHPQLSSLPTITPEYGASVCPSASLYYHPQLGSENSGFHLS